MTTPQTPPADAVARLTKLADDYASRGDFATEDDIRTLLAAYADAARDRDEWAQAMSREIDHYRDLLADAYVTIGCAVASEDGLDGSEADRFHAKVRELWPAAIDHPTVAKWLALPEDADAARTGEAR